MRCRWAERFTAIFVFVSCAGYVLAISKVANKISWFFHAGFALLSRLGFCCHVVNVLVLDAFLLSSKTAYIFRFLLLISGFHAAEVEVVLVQVLVNAARVLFKGDVECAASLVMNVALMAVKVVGVVVGRGTALTSGAFVGAAVNATVVLHVAASFLGWEQCCWRW